MTSPPSIPDETYEELIQATITALYKTGYADLGVRDIDAEFSKSRQLINHYFDGKDELLTELLEYIIASDEGRWADSATDAPLARLNHAIDDVLLGSYMDEAEFWPFMTVVYEIHAQAHHNPDHQALLDQISGQFIDDLSEILQDGIDQGQFRAVDTVRVARLLDDLITGAQLRKITLGHDDAPREARRTIDRFVVSQLLTDESKEQSSTL